MIRLPQSMSLRVSPSGTSSMRASTLIGKSAAISATKSKALPARAASRVAAVRPRRKVA
ncbi:hypothetical protein [Actinomadura luteofluorescens]|uniref:hypothetical protein n=1 Tax=Actinomadura luteofluorescens TaxID=46163 RepID=UPI003D8EE71C